MLNTHKDLKICHAYISTSYMFQLFTLLQLSLHFKREDISCLRLYGNRIKQQFKAIKGILRDLLEYVILKSFHMCQTIQTYTGFKDQSTIVFLDKIVKIQS